MPSSAIFFVAAVILGYDAQPAPTAFEFKDSAVYENRPVLQYRAVELHEKPVRPLGDERKFPEGALYGLLPVGPKPETALSIVWIPKAEAGPEIWLDSNADGKFSDDERHAMTGRDLEIPAKIAVQIDPPQKADRTLLFRRSAVGEGLRYTVRGYVQGRLNLGDKQYSVLIIDGNANGLFDNVGQDRVCVDLNADGRYDALTEQFPLGKTIVQGQDVYVISSDAAASAVAARPRGAGQGKIRLTLADKMKPATKITAELVSDLGELVIIDKLDEFTSVPFGQYRVSSLKLAMPDAGGRTWIYNFSQEKTKNYNVPTNGETTVALCAKLDMDVSLNQSSENKQISPGQTVTVQPRLLADGSLYLSSCKIGAGDESCSAEGNAEILLLSADGKTASRGLTGFS